MPKLYEYFGLIFLFYSDDHDPMHLHVQSGGREGRGLRTGNEG